MFAVHLPWVYRLAADNPVQPYFQQLKAGVAVFFLISGFLLYRPFARTRYAGDHLPATLPYAERRALRIFPAYWVALAGAVVLVGRSGEAVTATPVLSVHGALAYFPLMQVYDSNTLLGGISAAWTLSVELSFYVMLPLWAMLLRRVPVTHRASSCAPSWWLSARSSSLGWRGRALQRHRRRRPRRLSLT